MVASGRRVAGRRRADARRPLRRRRPPHPGRPDRPDVGQRGRERVRADGGTAGAAARRTAVRLHRVRRRDRAAARGAARSRRPARSRRRGAHGGRAGAAERLRPSPRRAARRHLPGDPRHGRDRRALGAADARGRWPRARRGDVRRARGPGLLAGLRRRRGVPRRRAGDRRASRDHATSSSCCARTGRSTGAGAATAGCGGARSASGAAI